MDDSELEFRFQSWTEEFNRRETLANAIKDELQQLAADKARIEQQQKEKELELQNALQSLKELEPTYTEIVNEMEQSQLNIQRERQEIEELSAEIAREMQEAEYVAAAVPQQLFLPPQQHQPEQKQEERLPELPHRLGQRENSIMSTPSASASSPPSAATPPSSDFDFDLTSDGGEELHFSSDASPHRSETPASPSVAAAAAAAASSSSSAQKQARRLQIAHQQPQQFTKKQQTEQQPFSAGSSKRKRAERRSSSSAASSSAALAAMFSCGFDDFDSEYEEERSDMLSSDVSPRTRPKFEQQQSAPSPTPFPAVPSYSLASSSNAKPSPRDLHSSIALQLPQLQAFSSSPAASSSSSAIHQLDADKEENETPFEDVEEEEVYHALLASLHLYYIDTMPLEAIKAFFSSLRVVMDGYEMSRLLIPEVAAPMAHMNKIFRNVPTVEEAESLLRKYLSNKEKWIKRVERFSPSEEALETALPRNVEDVMHQVIKKEKFDQNGSFSSSSSSLAKKKVEFDRSTNFGSKPLPQRRTYRMTRSMTGSSSSSSSSSDDDEEEEEDS